MKKIPIILLITFAASALFSCRTSHKVIRETYIRDTIVSIDTTIIIKADTVKSVYPCRDTIIIKEKERVKMITEVKDGVVKTICEAKPDEITIKKDKLVQVVKTFYQQEKKQQCPLNFLQILIISFIVPIGVILALKLAQILTK